MAASSTMRLPDEAAELAAGQYGAIARFQLLRWMTAGEVDGFVRRGWLVVIERGVYRVRGSAIVPEQAAMAAVLRTRDARVSGPFVLGLYGAEGFSRDDPFVVLARPGRWPRNVGFTVSADPCRGRHDATWGAGLPTVTPTMCLVDAAHPRRRLGERRYAWPWTPCDGPRIRPRFVCGGSLLNCRITSGRAVSLGCSTPSTSCPRASGNACSAR